MRKWATIAAVFSDQAMKDNQPFARKEITHAEDYLKNGSNPASDKAADRHANASGPLEPSQADLLSKKCSTPYECDIFDEEQSLR